MRSFLLELTALAAVAMAAPLAAADSPRPPVPPIVQRTAPGPGHKALDPLVGDWRVEKQLFVVIGTPDRPATSEGMTTHREWIADGRFLHDVTRGAIGGQPYYRTGSRASITWTSATSGRPRTTSHRS